MERRGFLGRLGVVLGIPLLGLKVIDPKVEARLYSNTIITPEVCIKEFTWQFRKELLRLRWRTKLGTGTRSVSTRLSSLCVECADFVPTMDFETILHRYIKPCAEQLAEKVHAQRIKTLYAQEVPKGGAECSQVICKDYGIAARLIRAYNIKTDCYLVRFDILGGHA